MIITIPAREILAGDRFDFGGQPARVSDSFQASDSSAWWLTFTVSDGPAAWEPAKATLAFDCDTPFRVDRPSPEEIIADALIEYTGEFPSGTVTTTYAPATYWPDLAAVAVAALRKSGVLL